MSGTTMAALTADVARSVASMRELLAKLPREAHRLAVDMVALEATQPTCDASELASTLVRYFPCRRPPLALVPPVAAVRQASTGAEVLKLPSTKPRKHNTTGGAA